jgi:glycosyltransferase involved in cell wall biosynthesis
MNKVLHIAETIKGGVATVLNQLSQCNLENYFVIPNSQKESLNVEVESKHCFSDSGRGFSSLIKLLLTTILAIKKVKPHVIHLHSSFSLVLAPFIKLASYKTTIIYQPHGVFYDSDVPRSNWKIFLIRGIERTLVMFVDKVISISVHEMELLVSNHGPNKVILLKNSATGSNESIDFERNRSGFLFVGRLDEQKGIDELLRFWSENTPGSLDVIGESVRGEFSKPLIKGVKYHGWVEANELDEFYANAEAVVVPSRWEGFGLVVIEAFRNGTPVITSDRGALPELINDGVTGFAFNFNEIDSELKKAISSFQRLADKPLMRRKCFEEYEKNYSLNKYLDKYEMIIKELINASKYS